MVLTPIPWSRLDQRRNAYLVFNDSVLEKALFVKELSRFFFLLYCFSKHNTLLFDFFPSCSGRHTPGKGGEQAENPVLVRCLALASPCAILQKPKPQILVMDKFDRITFDPQIMGGRACIRGMRLPVSVIIGQIAHGATTEEVLADYPDLEPGDIQQALEYAAWLVQEEVVTG